MPIIRSATFFTQNGVAGACGTVHKDSDIVCALDTPTYANGKHCGQKVAITNLKTGITVDVLVADVSVLKLLDPYTGQIVNTSMVGMPYLQKLELY